MNFLERVQEKESRIVVEDLNGNCPYDFLALELLELGKVLAHCGNIVKDATPEQDQEHCENCWKCNFKPKE